MPRITALVAACALAACAPALAPSAPAPSAPPDVAGRWEGIVRVPGQTFASALDLAPGPSGAGWSGTLDLSAVGMGAVPLADVAVIPDSVRFELPGAGASFAGAVRAGRLGGEVLFGPGPGTFELARPGTTAAAALAAEAASWDVASAAHPDSARVVTDDVARFWAAYDASTPETRAGALQTGYLDPGTVGLQDLFGLEIGSVEAFAAAVDGHPDVYARARAGSLRAAEIEPEVRAAYRRLAALYPDAVFPDLYVVVGAMTAAGKANSRGLVVAAERFPGPPGGPPLPGAVSTVVHELVHAQQEGDAGLSLLAQALREGVADYVAEMVVGAPSPADVATHAWADAREGEVWCAFAVEMEGADVGRWLYDAPEGDRPANLGYYVGYQIAEAYHERAREAGRGDGAFVAEAVRFDDARAFLDTSGYAGRFECARPGGE